MFAGGRVPPDALRRAVRAIKAQTDRPFGVNFLLAPPEPLGDPATVLAFIERLRDSLGLPPASPSLDLPPSPLPEQIDVVVAEGVPVLGFALGHPGPLVERGHAAGATVIATATTVDEAVQLAEGGVDVVVAQGAEAGGHRSTFDVGVDRQGALIGTVALVPQVVDAVAVPVVAAGGIMDGRGLAAVLALGAVGAQLGTRFLTARESGASAAYQERLLSATEADTVITTALTGRPTRSVRNRYLDEFGREGLEPLAWPFQTMALEDVYAAAWARDDADFFPLQAGQGLRLLTRGQGAAEIVKEIVEQAASVLSRVTGEVVATGQT